MKNLHKWTDIHAGSRIGDHTEVEAFTVIEEDVVIGENCWIGPHVTIMNGTRIGDNCKVFPGAVLGAMPQDLKFEGEESLLIIGDHTTVREYCTLNRGTKASGHTKIGNHVLLMAYVHVAHDCIIDDHAVLVNGVNLAGHVEVGRYAILGGLTAVHQFVKIGQHVMIGGGSLVRKDVPPYVTAAREPLTYMGVNSTGLRRRGFENHDIEEISSIYKDIFVNHNNVNRAIEAIQENGSMYKATILDFIKKSDRGLIKGSRKSPE